MLVLEEVHKRYVGRNFDVVALEDLSLTIPAGQYVSVVGKSGSGKSTLMKIMGLLDFDYRGRFSFAGTDHRGAGDRVVSLARRRIGYVFQDFQLIPRFTVRRNLELAMPIRTGRCEPEQVEHLLAEVGLPDKAESYPAELSGGQKQRVAIARAVLGSPDVLIADEPTGALDEATAASILGLLGGVAEQQGCALVVVTHDPDVAAAAHRTIELVAGRVHRDVLR